ncbi:hypothetical protein HOP52_09585 [Halomonas campisalis]|uniref:Nucleotide modification associated domain-containing protein n=1 Tax=Billgrantia campisalis TaxID=74661 RepID=A0ABS9P947_9GAMM|nr:hypothetical protein [Halomonas campisalis]MCG6658004.1 hypothetical protein [Halomonas campisalis]MDR5864838.1 hypothetical protein [Halomonas campisalis]
MKLILSRKGFDSAAGGVPSPILPDGRLLALPIPDAASTIRYGDITVDGTSLDSLVTPLTRGRIRADDGAHLDPDLGAGMLPRAPGWRPLFGQSGQAQGHLRNQGVGAGDLFLFFGLFRRIERHGTTWRWVPGTRPCHLIWGWLQIDSILPVDEARSPAYAWAHYHPHFRRGADPNNALYLARQRLALPGLDAPLPGAGTFPRAAPERQLTAPDAERVSQWHLPAWCYPQGNRPPLSYHANRQRWRRHADHAELTAAARGQEFVLDGEAYPEALPWAGELIRHRAG